LEVVSVLLPEKWFRDLEPRLRQRPDAPRVYLAEKKLLETLTGFSMYQGLLAVGRVPAATTLPRSLDLAPPPRLFVAVDGLTNAENLGGVVRNCVAFGAQTLLVGETSAHPFLRRAVRGSMGTVFHLPLVEPIDLAEALLYLRSQGVHCVAAHPHSSGRTAAQVDWRQDSCLVLGSEGYGLAPRVLEACDEAAAIPMPPEVDSLNVGAAAAVFLYEARRQRGGV
jgi:tRNA G18 (ribose-2'-O)-methylase SpoU